MDFRSGPHLPISGRGIFRYPGRLTADRNGSLSIARSGEVERIQRREFVRIESFLDVTVRGVDEQVGGDTKTVDISGSGIQIRDQWELPRRAPRRSLVLLRTRARAPRSATSASGNVPGPMADPKTEELQLEEIQRERAEREQADDSELEREERIHEARADKHAYLKEKLAERARSEEENG